MKFLKILILVFLFAIQFSAQEKQADPIGALLKEAGVLAGQQKLDEALAKCREAMALNPLDSRPYGAIGTIYREQRKFKESSEWYAKAIAIVPDDKIYYVLKADSDINLGAFDDAATAARKAVEVDPNFPQAHFYLAEALRWGEKNLDEAATAYLAAIRLAPHLHPFLGRAGDYFAYKEIYKSAEQLYRAAMAADPEKMSGRFSLGRMLLELDRVKEARELWEGRTKDEGGTMPQFITVLLRAERVQKAKDLVASKPNDPAALVELGDAIADGDHWVVDGRQGKAIEIYIKALAAQPAYVPAQTGIVKAYIQRAYNNDKYKTNVDFELAELKRLDPAQAKSMEEYRAKYKGGITVAKPK